MAKYFNTEHIHPYSWDQVAEAIFQRYPNPFARHVLSEDTVHRELIDGTTLYSRRFLTKTNKVPSWGEKWLSGFVKRVPLLEESFIDTHNKTITLYTRSIGLSTFMTAIEKVVYRSCPDNPGHTVAVKQAWVESNFYGLRSAIKNFGIERFKKNCVKATEGFNYVLEKFHSQHNSLRELGHVKLAEFQVKKDQLRSGVNEKVESLKDGVSERVESIKERSLHIKEYAKETAKEVKGAAEQTAKGVKERVKANRAVHARTED